MDAFRAYRFRLYPSRELVAKFSETFRLCAELYNTALEQRIISYRYGRSITYRMQQDELPDLRAGLSEFKRIHSQVMQDVLKRLDRAFKNYFDRLDRRKRDKRIRAGYPRFKSASSYSSITYPQSRNGWKVSGNGHVWLSKFGEVRTFMHRPMRGTPKTLTVKRDKVGDWFVVIVCKIHTAGRIPQHTGKAALGVDLGLRRLVATSSGAFVEAPKFYRKLEGRLADASKGTRQKVQGIQQLRQG